MHLISKLILTSNLVSKQIAHISLDFNLLLDLCFLKVQKNSHPILDCVFWEIKCFQKHILNLLSEELKLVSNGSIIKHK